MSIVLPISTVQDCTVQEYWWGINIGNWRLVIFGKYYFANIKITSNYMEDTPTYLQLKMKKLDEEDSGSLNCQYNNLPFASHRQIHQNYAHQ